LIHGEFEPKAKVAFQQLSFIGVKFSSGDYFIPIAITFEWPTVSIDMVLNKDQKKLNMQKSSSSDRSETPNLPKSIAAYFTADKGLDGKAVSQCFTENAIVKDEGNTYSGRAKILRWREVTTSKYQYTCEPFACEKRDGEIIVTSHLTGNFPGSPVDLRYFFKLEGDKISSLEIIP